jgi:hypothetical protein
LIHTRRGEDGNSAKEKDAPLEVLLNEEFIIEPLDERTEPLPAKGNSDPDSANADSV